MAEPFKQPVPYDEDFYAWTQDQAARLRARAHNGIDWENAAEEVESLGKSEKRAIDSRLQVLLLHLLKWRFQPEDRSSSWRGSIVEQRRGIAKELRSSPSLRSYPATVFQEEYDVARLKAAGETGLPEDAFPTDCPFTIEDILDPDFYPEAA